MSSNQLKIADVAWGLLTREFIVEVKGPEVHPTIAEAFESVGLSGANDDDVAWCSAIHNLIVERAGFTGTRNPMARSWLKWGEKVEDDDPRIGDTVVLWREHAKASILGHVGIYLGMSAGDLVILSGNVKNRFGIDIFPRMRLLGFRRVA